MSIKEKLDIDLKAAMLAGERDLVTTLRGLKSAILDVEIAKGSREKGLSDAEVTELFTKESKKRQESAEMYTQGGSAEKAAKELSEKEIISKYLPQQISDKELVIVVDKIISELGEVTQQQMGQIIGKVRAEVGASADGARIAEAVKARIT